MDNLHIQASKYTPEITMDATKGLVEIHGKSYPENTFEFYQPIIEWIEKYFENPKEETILNLELIYFNSSSSKLFFDFFDLLEENKDKSNITVNWIFDPENESAMEAGEEFIEDFEELTIKLQEKK